MRRVIDGKIYDTTTSALMCSLSCSTYSDDLNWNETGLYHSPKGQWFLAGHGNACSRWSRPMPGGYGPGEGIQLIDEDEARRILEAEGETSVIEALFEVEEG